MKNMFKILSVIIFIILTQINAFCQKTAQLPEMKPLWTVEEVKKMAKKYNMQDSVSATKNNLLLFMTKAQIEKYFQDEAEFKLHRKESIDYHNKTKSIRNYADYLQLLEQYPRMKALAEKSHGGKEGFAKYSAEAKKIKWQIYRSKDGGLMFVNPSSKCEEDLSSYQRLDNLQSK